MTWFIDGGNILIDFRKNGGVFLCRVNLREDFDRRLLFEVANWWFTQKIREDDESSTITCGHSGATGADR